MKLDRYTLLARLAPVAFVLLPVLLALVAWFPDQVVTTSGVAGAVLPIGLVVLLGHVGRDTGKRKEAQLFAQWGGPPTTQLLRHRCAEANPLVRARQHEKLGALLPHLRFPTPEQEATDPDGADRVYEAAIEYLRSKTRDVEAFRLIFAENINYGFRRNTWGMRPAGVLLALPGSAGAWAAAAQAWNADTAAIPVVLGSINVTLLVWWVVRVRTEWVRVVAFEYARQLLSTTEAL